MQTFLSPGRQPHGPRCYHLMRCYLPSMKWRERLLLVACATLTIGASARPYTSSVEVTRRFASEVCAGICTNETLAVFADGRVFWRPIGRYSSEPAHWRRRFFVKPRAAQAFIRAMNSVRPVQSFSDPRGCDAEFHIPGIWDWEVKWHDGRSSTWLRSCDQSLWRAWQAAMEALGMPYGVASYADDKVDRYLTQ